ncbi:E3 SUMO-protein ligase PIAS3-like [Ornithorhynchus anatinus]|uniref:E3 SUMO-protein ligase PIAS3-like n=1 Tax=Ornithorhynchus anatinus TaxID=9258 RepID=UPI0010A8E962|nr:E3 SUMO-protein ligase PIAS3-like [Ornithorhynchus anatinus]
MLLWSLSDMRDFAMSVCLVKQFTAEKLVQRLKSKTLFPSYRTLSMIREVMPAVHDPSFGLRRLRLSLLCPRNEEEETWRCPICDQEILYRNLVVDEYFSIILHIITHEKIDCEEIDILQDGTWVPAEYRLDALEIAGDPGFLGLRCQRINLKRKVQYATLADMNDSSTEVVASKKLPDPHPRAAILPPTSTTGASTTGPGPAQGSENPAQVIGYKVVPQPPDVCKARIRELHEVLKNQGRCREGKKRQRRRSRIPSRVLRDLLSCGISFGSSSVPAGRPPDSNQEISTTSPLDSSSPNVELQTPATTLATTPPTGMRRPQQLRSESSSLNTRNCPSSRPKQ